MNALTQQNIAVWLADFHLLALALLVGVLAALSLMQQPARRMAVAKATLAALAALPLLCALPGWSMFHLATPADEPAAELMAPAVESPAVEPRTPLIAARPLVREPLQAAPNSPAIAAPIEAVEEPVDWIAWTLVGYAAGSGAVLMWLASGAILARRIRCGASEVPAELQRLLARVAGEAPVPRLLASSAIATPVAIGVRRPSIILPLSFIQQDRREDILPILAHECAHMQNGDLWTLAASRLLLVLLWPQPLYWGLRRVIRLDQETLADAAAAEVAGRVDYAEQLLGWARRAPGAGTPRLAGAVGLWEGPSQLKRRVAILLNEKFAIVRSCSRRWRFACAGMIAIAAIGLSMVTLQPATQAADENAVSEQVAKPAETRHQVQGPAVVGTLKAGPLPKPPTHKKNALTVRVVDEAGKPIAGVEALLYRASFQKRTHEFDRLLTTNERGEAEFANLVPEELVAKYKKIDAEGGLLGGMEDSFLVALRRAGLSTVMAFQSGGAVAVHGAERTIMMRPAAELRGRVTDPQGRPVEGALVAAGGQAGSFVIEGVNATKTDADGRYLFTDRVPFKAKEARTKEALFLRASLAANPERSDGEAKVAQAEDPADDTGVSDLVVMHPDFAVTKVRGGDVPGTVDVTLKPAAAITGRVVHHGSGKPASGVTVHASGQQPTGDTVRTETDFGAGWSSHSATTTTDAAGQYRFVNLPAGSYDVWAQPATQNFEDAPWVSRGHGAIKIDAGEPTAAPDIVIGPPGKIRVQLVDAETGEPVRLKMGGWAQPFVRLIDGPQMQYTLIEQVPVSPAGTFEMRTIPGKVRSGVSVYLGKDRQSYRPVYQTDDDVHNTGPIFDTAHGETIDAEIRVYPMKRLEERRAREQKGHQLAHEKKYDEAIAVFDEILKENPKDAEALRGRGFTYGRAQRYAEAIADFEKLLELYPDDDGAKFYLADLLATSPVAGTRNGPRAVKYAEEVLALMQRSQTLPDQLASGLSMLAAAHAEAGEFDKAAAEQREAIELAPDDRKAELRQRLELYRKGKPFHRTSPADGDRGDNNQSQVAPTNVSLAAGSASGATTAASQSNESNGLVPAKNLDLSLGEGGSAWALVPRDGIAGRGSVSPVTLGTGLEAQPSLESEPSFGSNDRLSVGGNAGAEAGQDPAAALFGWRSRDDAKPNTLHGRCLDEQGRPLAGVEIVVYRGNPLHGPQERLHHASTDASGSFRFTSVINVQQVFPDGNIPATPPQEEPFIIWAARKEGRITREGARHQSEVARLGQAMDFVMPPAAELRGRITNEAGKPIVGARVTKLARMTRNESAFTAVTDANGEFAIKDLPPFDLAAERRREEEQKTQTAEQLAAGAQSVLSYSLTPRFVVQHPDYAIQYLKSTNIPGRVDAVLRPGDIITGRVIDAEGKPAAKTVVRVQNALPKQPWGGPDYSAMKFDEEFESYAIADTDGRYRITSLPPGKYDVWAEPQEGVNRGLDAVEVNVGKTTEAPDLRIVQPEIIRAQLVDVGTRKPIEAAAGLTGVFAIINVDLPSRQPMPPQTAAISPDGIAELKSLPGKVFVLLQSARQGENQVWERAQATNPSPAEIKKGGDPVTIRVAVQRVADKGN